ncbi:MAG: sigma-70 family RNA polymerase sigma factor [Verrucomicrobiales bacterium]|nr:sigma-70 family RNA polymerase sigma factor [Verrucomicrobiales bacterium]
MRRAPRDTKEDLKTRRSLLERLANPEDQEGWDLFYHLYSQLVYRFAIQRGLSDAEAKDVVQDTFLCVNKKVKDFNYDPAIGSFRSWLLHTTQWRISDQLKKRGQLHAAMAADEEDDSSRTAIIERLADGAFEQQNDTWDQEWRASLVEMALDRLKDKIGAKQFQVFELYVLKGWPVLKVAQTLGVNVGQVYLTKHRVAKLVKRQVQDLMPQFI